MLHRTTDVTLFYDILVESVCRFLRLLEQTLINQLKHRTEIAEFGVPQTYHFMPNEFGHFFTCIYPMTVKDDGEFCSLVARKAPVDPDFLFKDYYLANKRKNFHHQFGLAINRPFFRRSNGYLFNATAAKLLVNPHVGLKSQVADGKQYLVQGKYTYHHYMQDNFDDNGWGCAYRSLQTLCSWFRFQGYSAHAIPTHKDIQKCLADAGDKPKTFIGSRLWIGSTEVSICLNTFMNVDSKIMHVGSGGDLASKGAELAFHFETQGTPIMIGGGVLAHTILGVDYNSSTGDIRFLILDPHYTGADELATVQSKGWCAWKNAGFWDKKSYYNLCMPQKPAMY
jgi:Ufm1-specific protease 2